MDSDMENKEKNVNRVDMEEREIAEFKQRIQDAEMILIGIGEEFDELKMLYQRKGYREGRESLQNSELAWMVPAWNRMYAGDDAKLRNILNKFAGMLADKNYFVISVATNDTVKEAEWREGRLVTPCGGSYKKQCSRGCKQGLCEVNADDRKIMNNFLNEVCAGRTEEDNYSIDLGTCPECGSPLILNNIYTEKYDENGYLDQWQIYTKWLQGTLNRKLLILELGVGLQCPSVIRWPFEKVGFYNQKAFFYRINEKLYQLSEELSGKGKAISKNAIDWLEYL